MAHKSRSALSYSHQGLDKSNPTQIRNDRNVMVNVIYVTTPSSQKCLSSMEQHQTCRELFKHLKMIITYGKCMNNNALPGQRHAITPFKQKPCIGDGMRRGDWRTDNHPVSNPLYIAKNRIGSIQITLITFNYIYELMESEQNIKKNLQRCARSIFALDPALKNRYRGMQDPLKRRS